MVEIVLVDVQRRIKLDSSEVHSVERRILSCHIVDVRTVEYGFVFLHLPRVSVEVAVLMSEHDLSLSDIVSQTLDQRFCRCLSLFVSACCECNCCSNHCHYLKSFHNDGQLWLYLCKINI